MQWILGYGDGIEATPQQLGARLDFIRDVTNADVSPWVPLVVRGAAMPLPFLTCASMEGISGLFITAHADAVHFLCEGLYLGQIDIVVINSCLLIPNYGKRLLEILSIANPQIDLFLFQTLVNLDFRLPFQSEICFGTENEGLKMQFTHRLIKFVKADATPKMPHIGW